MDFAAMPIRDFCLALAAKSPAPGGGAVAALTAAQAGALLRMVVAYSRGKKAFAEFEEEAGAIDASLALAVDGALAAARADAEAYAALNALSKLPPEDPGRIAGYPAALRASIAAPWLIVGLAGEIADRCRSLAGRTAKALDSDLAIAADLAAAAARAAAWNVRANLPSLDGEEERLDRRRELDRTMARIDEDVATVGNLLAARG